MLGALFSTRVLNRSLFETPTSTVVQAFIANNEPSASTRLSTIYEYSLNTMLKVCAFSDVDCGNVGSPFRSEVAQVIMQFVLSKYVVAAGISPHICMSLGDPIQVGSKYIYMFMECANSGDVFEYLRGVDTPYLDDHFRTITFQVASALVAIYAVMPNFRHNDLKTSNVLVHLEKAGDTVTEYVIQGVRFNVPDTFGISARIIDFDLSCCAGVVENYKSLEFGMISPQTNINAEKNHRTDFAYFVKSLYRLFKPRLSPQLVSSLKRIYTREYLNKFAHIIDESSYMKYPNYMRGLPSDDSELPTVYDVLLRSDLYSTYRSPNLNKRTSKMYTVDAPPPPQSLEWPPWALKRASEYSRVVPIFKSLTVVNPFTETMPVMACMFPTETSFNYLDTTVATEVFASLFIRSEVTVTSEEDTATVVTSAMAKLHAKVHNVNGTEIEALAMCCLVDAICESGMYTLDTLNPDPLGWCELLGDRYTTEQFMQIMLQYSWLK